MTKTKVLRVQQKRERQCRTFLKRLFAKTRRDREVIRTWTKQDKVSRSFQTCMAAAKYVLEESRHGLDCYVGCCLYRPGLQSGRGKGEDVTRIVALWADVDCGKSNSFQSKAAALKWVRKLKPVPSMIVDSGGGYHVWWLLDKPIEPINSHARTLPSRWIKHLQRQAKVVKVKLDSVGDLPRILRVPGTDNLKGARPVRVKLLKGPVKRYRQDDFETILRQEKLSEDARDADQRTTERAWKLPMRKLASAVSKLEPRRASDYDDWLRVGMAIHSAFPGEDGLTLWNIFSKTTIRDNYDPEACRARWKSFDSKGEVTVASVFHMLNEDTKEKNRKRDPHFLAQLVLTTQYRDAYELTLRFYNGRWWHWSDRCFRQVPTDEVRARLNSQLRRILDDLGDDSPLTQHQVANVLKAMEGVCLVLSAIQMPDWVGPEAKPCKGELLAMRNGLLDLDAAIEGNSGSLRAHTPAWFCAAKWNYAYSPDASCPRWQAFLREVLQNQSSRQLLQEFLGYCLQHDTSYHKFLILVGEGANGKSVITDVATQLLGPDNVTHVPLEQFGDRFGMAHTIGKLANVVAEIGDVKHIAEDVLKAVVSGDRIKIEHKYHQPSHATPTVRLIFATNDLPRFSDRTEGLWRRLLVIPFNVSIPEKRQDRGLARKICDQELPGIMNWAIDGLRRLHENGRFTVPVESKRAAATLRRESNPARDYLLSMYQLDFGSQIACKKLYKAYVAWAATKVRQDPLNEQQFGKEVRRAFPEVRRKQIRTGRGREYVYLGITKK